MPGCEINLMANYPRTKREIDRRGVQKTAADCAIAREFDERFFDGSRAQGYGGFSYHPKYWQPVIPDFKRYYQLDATKAILDIGCAKGFMLYDIAEFIPGITVKGIDISDYAIAHSIEAMRSHCQVACATQLPFADESFDLILSINTLHNLERNDLAVALREIERVKRQYSFITVDAYRNDEERLRMEAWNLTAKTVMHVKEWKRFFSEVGYTGDYYWFIP